MARPIKEGADYFPHEYDLRHDRRMLAVRRAYGLEGYAVYAMMMETLTDSPGFAWTWNAEELELVAGDFQMTPQRLDEILTYLVERHLFQREGNTLTSEELIERMTPLIDKRERQREQKKRKKSPAKTPETEEDAGLSPAKTDKKICSGVFASESTQSRVKQSRAEQTRVEENKAEQSREPANTPPANLGGNTSSNPAAMPGACPPARPAALPADPGWWPKQKDLLCREFATILGLAPYGAAVQGEWKTIVRILDEVHALCQVEDVDWQNVVPTLRRLAHDSRDGRKPLGLFITKLRDTWPGIGRKAG